MHQLKFRKAIPLLACTAALSACDAVDTLSTNEAPTALSASGGTQTSQSNSGFGLTRPPVLQSRAVSTELLRPRVILGIDENSEVIMSRNGEQWTGSFSLPPDNGTELARYPLNVQWLYDTRAFPEGAPETFIILAEAPEQIITNESDPQITVASYSTNFDEDNDGTNNLAELEADRNPLADDRSATNVTPNAMQSDCRDTAAGLITRLAPIIRLSGPFSDTQAIERATGIGAYGQAFFLEVAGTLTAEKVGGLPVEGSMVLFDAPAGDNTERAIAISTTVPLRISTVLQPGIYCLANVVDDVDTQVFSDVSMTYMFQP